jgi:hypothetical protein
MFKIFDLPWRDRWLLLEAAIMLGVAILAVSILPFKQIARVAAQPLRRNELTAHERLVQVSRIRWAVLACARRIPQQAKCFQQGLAAQIMLRRRGVPSILYYGAAPDERRGLLAHVWVRDGANDVVGCDIANRFALLAAFPPTSNSSTIQKC